MTPTWAALLRLAAVRFAIPPAAFWRLSLPEWRALTREEPAPALPRLDLERLMARFPDAPEHDA